MKIKKRIGDPSSKRKKREGEPTKKKKRRSKDDDERDSYDDDDYEEYHPIVIKEQQTVFNLRREIEGLVEEALERHHYDIAQTVGVLTSAIQYVVETYEDD